MLSRFIIIVIGSAFLSTAQGNDQIATLKKSDPAPFAGTLLSPGAAAKVLATTEFDFQKCLIDSERALALQQAESTLVLKNKEAELAACQLRQTELANVYQQQIDFLEKRASSPDWQKPTIFIGGVLTGVAVVVLSAHVLNQIEN